MKGVLVDTSVWIDFFNDIKIKEADILNDYIRKDYPVYLCDVILQETLQGFSREKDYRKVKDILLSFPFLKTISIDFAIGAADLYRKLRKKGATIRKSNDCLIAYHSIYYMIPVLHRDRDFSLIEKHTKLKTINT
ncbi:MAG: PIN domain-containing protein [Desulfobacteraceae bacterium]|jgi:predicted nucleic acid-binding protein